VGSGNPAHGIARLSVYLLDTTVLIAHLRGDEAVTKLLLDLLADRHVLGTSCVNVAEVERGIRRPERNAAAALLARLRFLETTREAATRAGRYQAELERRGVSLHTADALVAGTAKAHGAILLTDNVRDFPMRDIKVKAPPNN
jgi:predicted nucleic acid-binding protein